MAGPTQTFATPGYDYGPPVAQGEKPDQIGVPQDNSDAVEVAPPGDSPMPPPDDATTVVEPGGSPTEESGQGPLEAVVLESVSPSTIDTGETGVVMTLTGLGSKRTCTARLWVGSQSMGEYPCSYSAPSTGTITLDTTGWPAGNGAVDVVVSNSTDFVASNQLPFTVRGNTPEE